MTWDDIREQYPHRWVVIEALEAHTEGSNRIIDKLILVAAFGDDWKEAWDHYGQLHRASPYREYYPIHTDRVELDIKVMDGFRRTL